MIMITGGAYQGKHAYLHRFYNDPITSGSDCDISQYSNIHCIDHYEILVKRILLSGNDPIIYTEKFYALNPDATVIINEIGCGIIPIEKRERVWREAVGKCGCYLAAHSDRVIRLVCGIPTAIKGELI